MKKVVIDFDEFVDFLENIDESYDHYYRGCYDYTTYYKYELREDKVMCIASENGDSRIAATMFHVEVIEDDNEEEESEF